MDRAAADVEVQIDGADFDEAYGESARVDEARIEDAREVYGPVGLPARGAEVVEFLLPGGVLLVWVIVLLWLAVALAPGAARAQEAPESPPAEGQPVEGPTGVRVLSIGEALELAARNNHQVRQSRAEVERTRLGAEEAQAGRWPNLSIDGRYTLNLAMPVIVLPEGSPFGQSVLRTGNRHNFNASAQATVPVYDARLSRNIGLSREVAALQEALHAATVREVEVEVQRAYVNGLLTAEALAVLQRSHATLQRNFELVRALHQEGLVPEYDLIRTEVQVRNVEPELARARTDHEGALNYLKLLTGLPIEAPIALTGTLVGLHAALPPVERYLAGSGAVPGGDGVPADARAPGAGERFARNREVVESEGQRAIAERQIALEQAAYFPSVSAFGNFNYQGQGNDLDVFDYNWTYSSAVGLAVTIPLFVGGRRQRVEAARVERLQAELQREFVAESLLSQYRTTASRIRELEATIAAQERNIAQAERGYAIALASYEAGVHSLLEVNDAEAALTEARLNFAVALADFVNAVLDMEDLLGSRLTTTAFGGATP